MFEKHMRTGDGGGGGGGGGGLGGGGLGGGGGGSGGGLGGGGLGEEVSSTTTTMLKDVTSTVTTAVVEFLESTSAMTYGSSNHSLLISLGDFITLIPNPATDLVKGISISTAFENDCPCGVNEMYELIALRPLGILAVNSS